VLEYIRWGENQAKTKSGKTPRDSLASKTRERNKEFYGWYDLGGLVKASIFVPRYAYYGHNFTLVQFADSAINESCITFIPKCELEELQLKCIAAYLNSVFNRLYIELNGRLGALRGGVSLDLKQAMNMPVIDVKKLTADQIRVLGSVFDKLEGKAREIGGAHTQKNMNALEPVFDEIDEKTAELLSLSGDYLAKVKNISKILKQRRLSIAEEAKPEAITGEEAPRIRPPRKASRISEKVSSPLDRWTY
jgi:hypothetical protein